MTLFSTFLENVPGWVVILTAVGLLVDRVWAGWRLSRKEDAEAREKASKADHEAQKELLELEYRRSQAEKVEAVRVQAVEAARNVKEVKTTLETTTARTEIKLDEIHGYVNSALQEAQRLYAAKCRDAARDNPTAANKAEAERAEAVYEAHRAQTEKMDREKANRNRLAPRPTGPITSAEMLRSIDATPKKVVDEIERREQSPGEGLK